MRQGLSSLLPLLLLIGCARPNQEAGTLALQDALAMQQASLAGIEGRPRPEAAAPGAPQPAGAGAPPTMAGQLVGQTPETLLRWLGTPRLRREEGPAEVWLYQASGCHLDLILYSEEGSRSLMRVAFASARATGTTRRGEAACLRDIASGTTQPEAAAVPVPGSSAT